jgi:hypothetical protein
MQRMLKIPGASATAIRAEEFRSMLDMVLNKMPVPTGINTQDLFESNGFI